jgi:hypothetical protein
VGTALVASVGCHEEGARRVAEDERVQCLGTTGAQELAVADHHLSSAVEGVAEKRMKHKVHSAYGAMKSSCFDEAMGGSH